MLLHTPDSPDFGTPAPDFTLKAPDGKAFSRDDLAGPNGLLVAFICNHCPYVITLIERLCADMRDLQSAGVGCVAIMANDYAAYPADAPDKMASFAAKYGLPAPYLVDETQGVARAFGAVCTPDFFGYDTNLTLQYRGRLDDAGMGAAANRAPELRNAMLAIAQGNASDAPQTPSMGCSLKWRNC